MVARQITGETPASTRKIPDGALSLKWSRVVCDSALHGEVTVGQSVKDMGPRREAHSRRVRRKAQGPRRDCSRQNKGPAPFGAGPDDQNSLRIPMAFTARSQRVRCGSVPIASSEVASFYGTRDYAILGNALVGLSVVKN